MTTVALGIHFMDVKRFEEICPASNSTATQLNYAIDGGKHGS
jgi:hypothetical protein